MAHILKNENLELRIDLPLENYNFSRFDWTGKIVDVKYRNTLLSSVERTEGQNEHELGKGFYNEFGIDTALGFDETEIGGWFHKIGVGLLRKTDNHYLFSTPYEIEPAEFNTIAEPNKVLISCKSEVMNGFSYVLNKVIELHEHGFQIKYELQNTGKKDIITDEYNHNFAAINRELVGEHYVLKFPFQLRPDLFGASVNPENKVEIGLDEVKFNGSPMKDFFFSNLSGDENVPARWELINLKTRIGIRETGSFQTNKVNLWGWTHVMSPELFYKISIKSGESTEWSRNYKVYEY